MTGQSAKSGQFFYYMCGNVRKRGRGVCGSRLLPKRVIEDFVIDRIKRNILTKENLVDLVRLTNEEIGRAFKQDGERLELIRTQIGDVNSRLERLYDALETGEFTSQNLAPRITALLQKTAELQQAEVDAEEPLQNRIVEFSDPKTVVVYVEDLKSLLRHSSIVEQRTFLKSFVQKIEVAQSDVTIEYMMPLPDDLRRNPSTESLPVLSSVQNGSPCRIRTRGAVVTL